MIFYCGFKKDYSIDILSPNVYETFSKSSWFYEYNYEKVYSVDDVKTYILKHMYKSILVNISDKNLELELYEFHSRYSELL
jgi:hypothetical protein